MVALTLGTFDGPMPLHFAEELSQAEIAGLYVLAALVSSRAAMFAGRQAPRPVLAVSTVLMTLSIALGGATEMIGLWVVVAVLCGLGVGAGEAGSLGVLLESIGLDRIVLAMVRLVPGVGRGLPRGTGNRRGCRRGVRLRRFGARAAGRQYVRLRRVRQAPVRTCRLGLTLEAELRQPQVVRDPRRVARASGRRGRSSVGPAASPPAARRARGRRARSRRAARAPPRPSGRPRSARPRRPCRCRRSRARRSAARRCAGAPRARPPRTASPRSGASSSRARSSRRRRPRACPATSASGLNFMRIPCSRRAWSGWMNVRPT